MSMKILHLIPSLNYSATTRQLGLLSQGLPREQFDLQICVLGEDDSAIGLLGPEPAVHVLGKTRFVNLVALWKLRRLLRSFQPDIIHASGMAAVRNLAVVGRAKSRLMVGVSLTSPMKPLDRWLLRKADRIVVRSKAEAERCSLAGLPGVKITTISLGLATNDHSPLTTHHSPLATHHSRLILCAGKLEPHKGYRDAIWALDIVSFLYPEIHLVLAGQGPDHQRLENFAQRNKISPRISFLGSCADMPGLLARATAVWVPSLADTGLSIALEAMAAGKAVIATNVPSLREIITDGRNGFLVPPGDKVALARRTCERLRNPDLARNIGEAARTHVQAFSAKRFVERHMALYRALVPQHDACGRSLSGDVLQTRVKSSAAEEPEAPVEAAAQTSEVF
ncbi:MAG TPA: glycosyltransferase family 4 protein [Gemmataceae bacterium]|nr:glycosyltransferase family 4 protein [Gemmataceae bacterium]